MARRAPSRHRVSHRITVSPVPHRTCVTTHTRFHIATIVFPPRRVRACQSLSEPRRQKIPKIIGRFLPLAFPLSLGNRNCLVALESHASGQPVSESGRVN